MVTKSSNTLATTAVLTVLACGMTACAGSSSKSPSADQNGSARSTRPAAEAGPVVLRVGTDDGPQAPGARQIEHFADRVYRLSNGSLKIDPVWHADGEGQPHWDQRVAHMAMNGQLDL